MGLFIGGHKDGFINLYDEIDFDATDDFFEVLKDYKIYQKIEIDDFRRFLEKENVHIDTILKFKKLVEYFDEAVKDVLLSDSMNAEEILSMYLKENVLFLPKSLDETEILSLIDEYIDLPQVNINVLREIITFPPSKGLSIPDKIKLRAKRKEKIETEKIFNNGAGIERGVQISYPNYQDEAILVTMDDRTADIKISRKWLEKNTDYPTLWNNFIYLFEFVDEQMRLELDSKKVKAVL